MANEPWDDRAQPNTERAPDDEKVAMPARLRLLVLSGPDRGRSLDLQRGRYVVGKRPDCDLTLTDPQVSREHLEIAVSDARVVLRDLESRNGSSYRGARFNEMSTTVGAVVQVGSTELQICADPASGARLPSVHERFGGLVGRSLAMRLVFGALEQVSLTDATVLIQGETGTGKELCAAAIHRASARAKGPFVVCDLGSLNRGLIDSELFGHVRGAFTGADRDRRGLFEQADGGTLFLDEIGELDLEVQPHLLRVLESREVRPVGSSRPRHIDVRIVAATNRDLGAEVEAGRFREDCTIGSPSCRSRCRRCAIVWRTSRSWSRVASTINRSRCHRRRWASSWPTSGRGTYVSSATSLSARPRS
jgi:transcriptional regulator of acetoin/glycerol metabolism